MKKFILLALLLLLPAICFAQETLTISTYYPSPYGSYRHLQLSATDAPDACDSIEEDGMMYFDDSEQKMKVCSLSGGSYAWRDLGSGGGSQIFIATNSGFTTSSNAWVDVPGLSIPQTFSSGKIFAACNILWSGSASSGANIVAFRMLIDGAQVAYYTSNVNHGNCCDTADLSYAGNITAASHTIKIQAMVSNPAESVTFYSSPANLTVISGS